MPPQLHAISSSQPSCTNDPSTNSQCNGCCLGTFVERLLDERGVGEQRRQRGERLGARRAVGQQRQQRAQHAAGGDVLHALAAAGRAQHAAQRRALQRRVGARRQQPEDQPELTDALDLCTCYVRTDTLIQNWDDFNTQYMSIKISILPLSQTLRARWGPYCSQL